MNKTLTNTDIEKIYNTLHSICNTEDLNAPLLLEWALTKNLNTFTTHMQNLVERNNQLIAKHGKKDGEQYMIEKDDEESMRKYRDEAESLFGENIDVSIITIDPETLKGFNGIGMSKMSQISFMIE